MFLYNFLLLNILYLLKPVRDSLFLTEMGFQQLPWVFILTAGAVIPISLAYSKLSKKMILGWLVHSITLFLVVNLIIMWWLLQFDSSIVYYVLYIWVSIYSVLITSQFWLVANAIFTSTQAKRIFTLLSAGAILGSITGGEITGFLVNVLGVVPQNLLLIGAAILLSTMGIVQIVRLQANSSDNTEAMVHEEKVTKKSALSFSLFQQVLRSKHLLLIMGIIALSVIATTIIDYQFKTIASQTYTTNSSLTAFMGQFYGRVSIIALLIQSFLAPKFIKWQGVGGAVAILPSLLLLGSVGLLVWPGLVAATMLRGAEQSLKHSVDRTGRELLFLPVDLNLKKRTKVFIDLFVDHGAQGMAGLMLLLLTLVFSFTVQQLAIVVAGLIIIWLILALWIKQSYINEFRNSLEEKVGASTPKNQKSDSDFSLQYLFNYLQSEDISKILTSLKEIEANNEIKQVPEETLLQLLEHPNDSIRIQCLKVFRSQKIDGYIEEVAELLEDPDPKVRLEAARYVYHFYDPQKYEASKLEILEEGLYHQDAKIRAAALGLIAKDGGEHERSILTTEILEQAVLYQGESQKELKYETARVLGKVYNETRKPLLETLLHESTPPVVKKAIISAGQSGDRIFVPKLLTFLEDETFKNHAQQALSLYGERILGTLFDYLTDDQLPESVQLSIPPILTINGSQVAFDVLQISMDRCKISVRHAVIRALNKIQNNNSDISVDKSSLQQSILTEKDRYVNLSKSLKLLNHHSISSDAISFYKLLSEEIEQALENIFRLLGLLYNSEDIYNAYKGIDSENKALRADSIEFVENIISWELKQELLPLLEFIQTEDLHSHNLESSIYTLNEAKEYLRSLSHPQLNRHIQMID